MDGNDAHAPMDAVPPIDASAMDAVAMDATADATTDAPGGETEAAADAPAADAAHVGAGPLAGNYMCTFMGTTHFTAPIDMSYDNTGIAYPIVANGTTTDLTIDFDMTLFGACVLGANRMDNHATIVPGQMCTSSSMGTDITFTVTSGSADYASGGLTIMVAGTVVGTMSGSMIMGTYMATYTCTPA
jgi:hypothetical protein